MNSMIWRCSLVLAKLMVKGAPSLAIAGLALRFSCASTRTTLSRSQFAWAVVTVDQPTPHAPCTSPFSMASEIWLLPG